jgi:DNA-binding transcriptional regulator YiaG
MPQSIQMRHKGLKKDLKEFMDVRAGRKATPGPKFERWKFITPPSREEVIAIRKSLKMSQSEFASFLFMATNTIQSWEQGKRRPDGASAVLLRGLASSKGKQMQAVVAALHAGG